MKFPNIWAGMRRVFGLSPGPTDDFWYGPVGQKTVAGVRVDENTAMTYSGCWAATMILSSSGAMIPLKLMEKQRGGGSEPLHEDPRYGLVHDSPNPENTSMMWRATGMNQQINRGNWFAEIGFNDLDVPAALYPIHASRIPVGTNIKRGPDGQLRYYINNDDGTKTELQAREVLHIPSPISDDGITGRGVIENARLSIGFGIATETQGAAYFGNSSRPTLVFETDPAFQGQIFKDKADREDFRRQWSEVHAGPENNAKPGIAPKGLKLTALTWSAQDSQFLETRQHNIEEIARWYGVPPHMIGHLLRSTNNNIEQQSLEFVKFSMMRWLVLIEQELNKKLLTPEERKTKFFKHNVDALERADLMTRTQALHQQWFDGSLNLDEWRDLEDRNPVPNGLGKIHWTQQAMVPLDIAAKGPQQPEKAEKPAKNEPKDDELAARVARLESRNDEHLSAALIEVVDQVVTGMLEREAKHAVEASRDPRSFNKWLDSFYDDHARRMERALSKPIRAYLLLASPAKSPEDVLRDAVARHVASGREALLAAASVPLDQFPKSVETCVTSWSRRDVLSYLGACNGKGI